MLPAHRMSHEAHYGNLPIMSKNVFYFEPLPYGSEFGRPTRQWCYPGMRTAAQAAKKHPKVKKVELAGFEPATPCLQSRCSTN